MLSRRSRSIRKLASRRQRRWSCWRSGTTRLCWWISICREPRKSYTWRDWLRHSDGQSYSRSLTRSLMSAAPSRRGRILFCTNRWCGSRCCVRCAPAACSCNRIGASRRDKKPTRWSILRFGDVCPVPALVLDISEDGLAVQASEPLPAAELPLRFILPGTTYMIEGSGEVTWADDSGRAGIFFSELTPTARRQLKAWLSKQDKRKPRSSVLVRTAKSRLAANPAH